MKSKEKLTEFELIKYFLPNIDYILYDSILKVKDYL